MFDVRLLGGVEVRRGSEPVRLGGRQPRAVAASLALSARSTVTVEALIAAIWGETPPASARATLQSTLSRLRSRLGRQNGISTDPGGYRWELDPLAVDVHRFRRLVRQASARGEPWQAAVDLREALAEWRGPALAGLEGLTLFAATAPALERERLSAEIAETEALIVCGQADAAAGRVAMLLEEHPLDERLRAAGIRALAASGRVPDALRAYEAWRRTLADELGTAPSPRVRALRDELLEGDGDRPAAPRPDRELVGRGSLLRSVVHDLRDARVLDLHGPDGVGLSSVGRALLHGPAGGRTAAFVDARAGGAWLAGSAARAAGLAPDPGHDPTDALELAFSDRPILLVLDDVDGSSVGAARALAVRLVGANDASRVVLLHRGRTPSTSRPVRPLPHRDEDSAAHAALRQVLEARDIWDRGGVSRSDLRALASLTSGLPLAIELVARGLDVMPAAKLVQELRDRRELESDVLTALAELLLTTLPEPGGAVVRMLATVDSGLPTDEVAALAAGTGADPGRVGLLVDSAVSRGLLRWSSRGSLVRVPRGLRRRISPGDPGDRSAIRAAIARGALLLLERETVPDSRGELDWLAELHERYPDLVAHASEAIDAGDLALAARLVRGLTRRWEVAGPSDDAMMLTSRLLRTLPGDASTWRAGLEEVRGRVAASHGRDSDAASALRSALATDVDAPPLTSARRERLLAVVTPGTTRRRELLASAARRATDDDPATRRERAAIELLLAQTALDAGDHEQARAHARTARACIVGLDALQLRSALDALEQRLEYHVDPIARGRRLAQVHDELARRARSTSGLEQVELETALGYHELLLGATDRASDRLVAASHAATRLGNRRVASEATALAAHAARMQHDDVAARTRADQGSALRPDGAAAALVLATRAWAAWCDGDIAVAGRDADEAAERWSVHGQSHPLDWTADVVLVALGSVPGRAEAALHGASRCVLSEAPWLPGEVLDALARYLRAPDEAAVVRAVRTCREHRVL